MQVVERRLEQAAEAVEPRLEPAAERSPGWTYQSFLNIHRKATAAAIHKAMHNKPDIHWLLENQAQIVHKYCQMGLDGKL